MIKYVADLIRYRELIELLTAREIKIRYKQSVLGIAWALFQPLVLVGIFSMIFSRIVKMPTHEIPYPIFFLAGLIPWTFFANSLNSAIPSIVSNADLVKKIYFPRVIFPLVSILANFFDFFITLCLLFVLIFIYRIELTAWILMLPAILLLQFVLIAGVSLLLSALNVFYRDVKNALSGIIQIWMFATPIIYPLDVIRPQYQKILMLNPMTGIVNSFRRCVIRGIPPRWDTLAVSIILTLIIFTVAYIIFKKAEPKFADSI